MLVLSRKVSERIMIGEGITLTVVRLKAGRVQLGIEAPDGVIIRRAELPLATQRDAPRSTGSPSRPR